MRRKLIASLLTTLVILGVTPVSVSAEWKQNSDSSWSWTENGYDSFYDGWREIEGKWYYFDMGKMKTGWLKYCNTWYYLGNDGARKTGWVNDGGLYYLKDDDTLATDIVINGLYFNSKGIFFPKEKQKVLIDNEYVKIIYLGMEKESFPYKKVEIQVENKCDQELYIRSKNTTVDGLQKYGAINLDIAPRKTMISNIAFQYYDIQTNFDSVEGDFDIESYIDFKTLYEEAFSIKF